MPNFIVGHVDVLFKKTILVAIHISRVLKISQKCLKKDFQAYFCINQMSMLFILIAEVETIIYQSSWMFV